MITSTVIALVLLSLAVLVAAASSQMICCSDAVYSFSLNLEQTCEDSNITGSGIAETSCFTTFLQPVPSDESILLESVRKVDIFEVGPGYELLARKTVTGPIVDGEEPGPLLDGEAFEYRSVVSAGGVTPNALQVVVTAVSSEGTLVLNVWQVTFRESCILPVFPEGSRIGWTNVAIECSAWHETDGAGKTEDGDTEIVTGDTTTGGKGSMMMKKRKRHLQRQRKFYLP